MQTTDRRGINPGSFYVVEVFARYARSTSPPRLTAERPDGSLGCIRSSWRCRDPSNRLWRSSSRFPTTSPNNAYGPGDQPWAVCIVEVPGIEPGSAQIQSGLLRA